jgi:DNA-binding Lrp family transcriptional regulator
MPLKPQDIMVVLKLCSYQRKRPPMSIIAAELKMSPSEVHAAIKRLQQARLLHGPELEEKPNLSALEEFLLHGVKYSFPAERGQVTRGLPTSFAAPPLNKEIAPGDKHPPV